MTCYHIGLKKQFWAKYAILPGDPGRVEKIASFLENPKKIAQNREYTTWMGELAGEAVLVTSTGIGGPSAAIAAEELYPGGVRAFIRVGTCGGMQPEVSRGELVIPTAAVRMEGASHEYAPPEFPAAADFTLVSALARAAETLGFPFHTGVVQSKDSFYGQHDPSSSPVGEMLKEKWDAWLRLGVLASEMESAALFTVAAARGMQAGCVLYTVWNQEAEDVHMDDAPPLSEEPAIRTAVEALRIIIRTE